MRFGSRGRTESTNQSKPSRLGHQSNFAIRPSGFGNDRRIVRHGYVPEFDGIWAVCDVMICPMLSGSGVNVKLVEALYNRMPVLATHFAARGVQLPDDPAIKLLDGAEEWIAFLSSPAADRLSDSMVPKELAEAFSAHRHSEPVHRFLGNVVKPADGRQA